MRSKSAALSVLLLFGCSGQDHFDPPTINYETQRSEIGVSDEIGFRLCAADLQGVDRRVAFVQAHLGVSRDEPVTIYWVPTGDDWIVGPCPSDTQGCILRYPNGRDEIYVGGWDSVDHEIVHAVTKDIDFPSLFWNEGCAEVLSGKTTRKDTRITLTAADLDADSLTTYLSAAHFARFLIETRGWESYNRAIRGEPLENIWVRIRHDDAKRLNFG